MEGRIDFKKLDEARKILGLGEDASPEEMRDSFREKDVKKNTMSKEEYEHLKRFYDGWFGDLGL